jgi:predicted phosphoadenosine phosphosulfate sulfurtransferase
MTGEELLNSAVMQRLNLVVVNIEHAERWAKLIEFVEGASYRSTYTLTNHNDTRSFFSNVIERDRLLNYIHNLQRTSP